VAADSNLTGLVCAGGKIDLFTALAAFVGFVKLVGENLLCFSAFGAVTGKRLQGFKIFKTGAMLRCAHNGLLLLGLMNPVGLFIHKIISSVSQCFLSVFNAGLIEADQGPPL
jgi:hypothetical protein